ncbi:hypothetical protein HAX54_000274 [Datura stramonium]|uniref:Uncharacterized protein n=1 Tax=Datura stramonium TaxID=4076 RepID=A0ABS8T0S4_DATST|nr:hypothetical protein [Datura stramonium]
MTSNLRPSPTWDPTLNYNPISDLSLVPKSTQGPVSNQHRTKTQLRLETRSSYELVWWFSLSVTSLGLEVVSRLRVGFGLKVRGRGRGMHWVLGLGLDLGSQVSRSGGVSWSRFGLSLEVRLGFKDRDLKLNLWVGSFLEGQGSGSYPGSVVRILERRHAEVRFCIESRHGFGSRNISTVGGPRVVQPANLGEMNEVKEAGRLAEAHMIGGPLICVDSADWAIGIILRLDPIQLYLQL